MEYCKVKAIMNNGEVIEEKIKTLLGWKSIAYYEELFGCEVISVEKISKEEYDKR